VVEQILVGIVAELITPVQVLRMDDVLIELIAAELPETIAYRQELKARLALMNKGIGIVRRYLIAGARTDSNGLAPPSKKRRI
jgi:hypothetical protein